MEKQRTIVFYSRMFGDDQKGDGSARAPYRTYEGAVKKLPLLCNNPPKIRSLEK